MLTGQRSQATSPSRVWRFFHTTEALAFLPRLFPMGAGPLEPEMHMFIDVGALTARGVVSSLEVVVDAILN